MALVYLDKRVLPEVLTIVLHPKGNVQLKDTVDLRSPGGWSRWELGWRMIELWKLPADQLIAAADPGLAPWIPLTHFDGAAEPVFHKCREIIERVTEVSERENLLAVTQILARLRYNDRLLMALFGGRQPMIESPLIQEIVAEARQ